MKTKRCFSCGNGCLAQIKEDGVKVKYKGLEIILSKDTPAAVCDNCGEVSVRLKDVEAFGCAMLESYELAVQYDIALSQPIL